METINVICSYCRSEFEYSGNLSLECKEVDERGMGIEQLTTFSMEEEFTCPGCAKTLSSVVKDEYPYGIITYSAE